MDKLLEMEEQLKRNVGAMDEEGQAKLAEACEYIKEHGIPEVRQRLLNFLDEGMALWKKDLEERIARYEEGNNEEALKMIDELLEEVTEMLKNRLD